MRKVRIRSPTKESPHDRGLSTVTVNRICGNSFVARSLYRIFSRFKRYRGVNMKKHFQDSLMCVWDIRHRKAGSAKIDGKEISWEDADQLIGIPLESSSAKVMKHAILPEKVEVISQKLEHISWGALIQLTFSGKYIVVRKGVNQRPPYRNVTLSKAVQILSGSKLLILKQRMN